MSLSGAHSTILTSMIYSEWFISNGRSLIRLVGGTTGCDGGKGEGGRGKRGKGMTIEQ